ncbi:MAG: DNA repair protein [Zoogloeaceae bacterium]|nr:DNA repair protein [Zoogloeaceae bacterium]
MATANCTARREREDRTIARALRILEKRNSYNAPTLDSPYGVRKFLHLRLHSLEREEFWCIWLDSQHRLVELEQMFISTLSEARVYPREVVKSALRHNAAAVIFAHNHPSGHDDPSNADLSLTKTLKDALSLVDVKVLDHFIIGSNPAALSLAERGLI